MGELMINPSDFYKWLQVFGVGTDQPPGTFATQLQVQGWVFNTGTDTGTANAYAVALNPAIAAYTDKLVILFTPLHSNTLSNPTLALNGLAAKTITLTSGSALNPSDLVVGTPALLIYNLSTTSFMLINPANNSGGFAWSGISGITQLAVINNGYVIQNSAQTTVTLPATAPLGSIVSIRGLGAAGWVLTANTGQTINVDGQATSSGGTLTSSGANDTIDITCVVANTTWSASSVISSGLTYA